MVSNWKNILEKIDDQRWLLPKTYKPGMRVPGLVFASEDMLGVISPGGVGFDINCGTRLLRTNLTEEELRPHLKDLVNQTFRDIPAGIGGSGLVKVSIKEIDEVMVQGARWALEHGYAWPEDVDSVEGGGALEGANPPFTDP